MNLNFRGRDAMNLSEVNINERFQINDLTDLDPAVKRRLKELGVYEGKSVKVLRHCPFGGPCLLECSGQLFGLRKKDTYCIKGELMG
jgi:ferrous iron transport protein A